LVLIVLLQVYMLSLTSQPVDHEEPGKQMVLGDQVSQAYTEEGSCNANFAEAY
jgi:hypothetical protein